MTTKSLAFRIVLAAIMAAAPACVFAQTGTGAISGRITETGSGLPLAGAKVLARWNEFVWFFTTFETVTDADGRYHFDELPLGRYGLEAYGDAFHIPKQHGRGECAPLPAGCSYANTFSLTSTSPQIEINLDLARAGVLEGTIRSAATNLPLKANLVAETQTGSRYASTDEQGHFRLESLRANSDLWLKVSGEDHLGASSDGQICDAFKKCTSTDAPRFQIPEGIVTTRDLVLQPGAHIGGRLHVGFDLLPWDTRPSYLSVRIRNIAYPSTTVASPSDWNSTLLTYVAGPFLPGQYTVQFGDFTQETISSAYYGTPTCDEYGCYVHEPGVVTLGNEGIVTGIDGYVFEMQSLQGQVVDLNNGQPLSGIRIDALRDSSYTPVGSTLSGADGRFHLHAIAAGNITLRLLGADRIGRLYPQDKDCDLETMFCSGSLGQPAASGIQIYRGEYQSIKQPIAMASGTSLRGAVRERSSGAPLPGATVLLYLAIAQQHYEYVYHTTMTDKDGRYVIPGLNAGLVKLVASIGSRAQMYPQLDCPGNILSCALGNAQVIDIGLGTSLNGLDFTLDEPGAIFSAGFDH